MIEGGCSCGDVRYRLTGDPLHHALCHCADCRKASGAPVSAWAMFPDSALTMVQGTPKIHASSEHGRRAFCGACGTGLFYRNAAILPGLVDVRSATFDDPEAIAPTAQVQVAERLHYMADLSALPSFDRYPAG